MEGDYRYIEEVKTERTQGPSHTMPTNAQKKKNPIITVTEHTPTPSPDYLSKTRQVNKLKSMFLITYCKY